MPRAVQDPDKARSCGFGWAMAAGAGDTDCIDGRETRANALPRMYASAQNALVEAATIAQTARFLPNVDQLMRQRNIMLMHRTAAAMAFCLSALPLGGYSAAGYLTDS